MPFNLSVSYLLCAQTVTDSNHVPLQLFLESLLSFKSFNSTLYITFVRCNIMKYNEIVLEQKLVVSNLALFVFLWNNHNTSET